MHELSLSSAILATCEKHAAGRPVKAVYVQVGGMRQVVPDSLLFYFNIVAQGTICDGATLEIEVVPTKLHCDNCDNDWNPDFPTFRCPFCVDGKVKVVNGEEFLVDSIEVEEDEHASHQS